MGQYVDLLHTLPWILLPGDILEWWEKSTSIGRKHSIWIKNACTFSSFTFTVWSKGAHKLGLLSGDVTIKLLERLFNSVLRVGRVPWHFLSCRSGPLGASVTSLSLSWRLFSGSLGSQWRDLTWLWWGRPGSYSLISRSLNKWQRCWNVPSFSSGQPLRAHL